MASVLEAISPVDAVMIGIRQYKDSILIAVCKYIYPYIYIYGNGTYTPPFIYEMSACVTVSVTKTSKPEAKRFSRYNMERQTLRNCQFTNVILAT